MVEVGCSLWPRNEGPLLVAGCTARRSGPICRRFSCTLLIPWRGEKGAENGQRREGESASRVSGSVGRVTERFRVPLAPALTRLPDTVTSVIREYPPRAVSPFSLKHAARSSGRKTFAPGRSGANSSNRGKIAIPLPAGFATDLQSIYGCSFFFISSRRCRRHRLLLPRTSQFRLHQLDSLLRLMGNRCCRGAVSRTISFVFTLYVSIEHRWNFTTVNRGVAESLEEELLEFY